MWTAISRSAKKSPAAKNVHVCRKMRLKLLVGRKFHNLIFEVGEVEILNHKICFTILAITV